MPIFPPSAGRRNRPSAGAERHIDRFQAMNGIEIGKSRYGRMGLFVLPLTSIDERTEKSLRAPQPQLHL